MYSSPNSSSLRPQHRILFYNSKTLPLEESNQPAGVVIDFVLYLQLTNVGLGLGLSILPTMTTSFDVFKARAGFPALKQDHQVYFDNAGGSQILGTVAKSYDSSPTTSVYCSVF